MALNTERWKRVDELLQAALEIAPERRDEFLLQECSGDAALLAEIHSLLASHRNAGDFLQMAAINVAAQDMAVTEAQQLQESPTGEVIPRYRILKLLGRGGMGSVWLAERSDGRFDRQVAIKFINKAVVDAGSVGRFKREGSILGRLAHTHIAELMDAGVTATGEPYLVLEYVEGCPIDQYCDEQKLTIEARITLFLDVLSAISHAHANLIVHRDIKPSNVLVRKDGQVKLLDFGIAKLMADQTNPASPSLLTIEDGGMLTPRFAAPEQVTKGPITTATDVYALGVLLYLLLTGQHPAGTSLHSHAALVKAIVETEAPPPSVAPLGANATVAEERSTTPDKLHRQLRGDLDTILGKALKKDPSDRYASAAAFADDLRHYLKHEPIAARPDTVAYRTAKFVRRNRLAVALVSLVVLATIAGIAGTLVQARTARRQRDFALHQLSRAEAINELNTIVLEKNQTPELIDRAERILSEQQESSLADRVEILITLGRTADISKDGGAQSRRLLEQAYQLSRGLRDPSTQAKAACALAGEVSYGADPVRSEALFHEGLNVLPAQPEFALDRAFCLQIGAAVSRAKGVGSEAISRLQLAKQVLKQSPIPSWRLEFLTSLDLGTALRIAGRYRESATTFQQAAARLAAEGRGDTGAAASVYYGWGLTLSQLGRPLEAERVIHRAVVIDSGGEEAPDALPWQLVSHARALRDLGRLDQAAAEAERAYAGSLKSGDQVRVRLELLLRASIYRMRGDIPHAQEMLAELQPRLRGLAPGNIFLASLLLEKALIAQAGGDTNTAVDSMNQALAIAQASVRAGQQGADLVPILLTYRSELQQQMGRIDDAVADANQALALIQEAAQPGTSSVLAGHARLALGRAFQAQQKNDRARANFQMAAEQLEQSLGRDNAETVAARRSAQ